MAAWSPGDDYPQGPRFGFVFLIVLTILLWASLLYYWIES